MVYNIIKWNVMAQIRTRNESRIYAVTNKIRKYGN